MGTKPLIRAAHDHTQASGVGIGDDVVENFNQIKTKHAFRYALYGMNADATEIVVKQTAPTTATYDDFLAALPQVSSEADIHQNHG